MLLSETFIKYKKDYTFNCYGIKKEEKTNIYTIITLTSDKNIVRLDVEEIEGYVSFLISHNTSNGIIHYYGLADYSSIVGEKRSVFKTKEEEQEFMDKIRNCLKNCRKLFSAQKHQDELVHNIYSFLEKFIIALE